MADEKEVELAETPKKSSKMKVLVFAIGGALLIAAGTAGGMYFMLGDAPPAAPGTVAGAAPSDSAEAVYVAMTPAFTVNFTGSGPRYLQLNVEAMTRDPSVESEIKKHMPVIRDRVTMLLSAQEAAQLATREGKEKLQNDILATLQEIIETETGTPGVEAVYFTSFVMQ